MIKPELLAIFCCPETHAELSLATPELIAELNRKIAAGQLKNRAGEVVKEAFEGGLVRADGKFIYIVRNEIPVMLIDQAVPLA
jgi:uncharacterized protein YbaR (Trm112 family)